MLNPLCRHSTNSENKYINIMKHTNHTIQHKSTLIYKLQLLPTLLLSTLNHYTILETQILLVMQSEKPAKQVVLLGLLAHSFNHHNHYLLLPLPPTPLLHGLGQKWSVPPSWRVCWSLHLHFLVGSMLELSSESICLPFIADNISIVTWIL